MKQEATRALILFGHGARDEEWRNPFDRLQTSLMQQHPELCVKQAFLAMMTPTLPAVVAELEAANYVDISIVPLFIGQGGHVRNDFQTLVTSLHKQYPQLNLKTKAAIGESETVLAAIAQYCVL